MNQYKWVYGVNPGCDLSEYEGVDALVASGYEYDEIRAADDDGRVIEIATREERTIEEDETHKTVQEYYLFTDGSEIHFRMAKYERRVSQQFNRDYYWAKVGERR